MQKKIFRLFTYFSKGKYCLASFGISVFSMGLLLFYAGVTPYGRYTIVNGDMLSIYIPAIKNLCRDIIEKESIYFSWNTSLGMNTSLYNAFYAYSPFNLIYLIFRNSDINVLTTVVILLKTGLAAAGFQLFVGSAYKVDKLWSVVISVCYSLCSFQIAYNMVNIIWLDAMFVLPLVFLHIHLLVYHGKYKGLFFWYFFIFVSQFYMGYMIGIISFFYFLICLYELKIQQKSLSIKILVKYIVAVIAAIGSSAFVWLPTLYFIREKHLEDSTRHVSYHINVLDVVLRAAWGQIEGVDAYYPNIYCGTLIVSLCVIFFFQKGVAKRIKLTYGIILCVMIVSCTIDFLFMFWHGFDIPDGWPYRFSYIISFLMCLIAAMATENIEKTSLKTIFLVIVGIIAFYSWGLNWQYKRIGVNTQILQRNVLVNLVLFLLGGLLIISFIRIRVSEKKYIMALICLLATVEIVSGYKMIHISSLASELIWYDSMENASGELGADRDFYRVNSLYDLCVNSGTMFGFNGISHFASAENENTNNVLADLGVFRSSRITQNYGITPVTEMLLGVKYTLKGALGKIQSTTDLSTDIIKNEKCLGIGYMVAGNPNDYSVSGSNAFENNDHLLTLMTGKMTNVFNPVDPSRVYGEQNGIDIIPGEHGFDIIKPAGSKSDGYYVIHVKDHDKPCYCYFYSTDSGKYSYNDYFVLDGGYENALKYDGDISVSYIKAMEKSDSEYQQRIIGIGNIDAAHFDELFISEYDETELEEVYKELAKEQMLVDDYRDGYIRGNVSVTDDKTLLFTTIPFDSGWEAKINGTYTEVLPVLDGAFAAVMIPGRGDYDVEFEYVVKGEKAGIAISIVFLSIGIICSAIEIARHKCIY